MTSLLTLADEFEAYALASCNTARKTKSAPRRNVLLATANAWFDAAVMLRRHIKKSEQENGDFGFEGGQE